MKIFAQSWGLRIVSYLPNATSDVESEDTGVISDKKYS